MIDFENPESMPSSAVASAETEASLLGGLLLDNGHWDRVGDMLAVSDFSRLAHQLIFGAAAALINASKPADAITVFEELRRHGSAEMAGGLEYLHSLTQYVPSASNIRKYAETVRDLALRRTLMAAGSEIIEIAQNRKSTFDETLEAATSKVTALFDTRGGDDDWQDAQQGMTLLIDRINEQASGTAVPDFTPTGLTDLDARLDGGLRGGELYVIGARPGMGKSALGLSIAAHIAIQQRLPMGVFSMEMPKRQMFARLMALVSQIHLSRIKRGERLTDSDWPHLTEAVDQISHAPISINDRSGLNINQVRASARALRRRRGKLGVLMVDYLGLMAGTDPKQSRTYQLEEASSGLKSLAKELDCPILLLAQLNRKVEERIDQMPLLSDLRDSGAIEQDADAVIFVHRPIKAKPDLGSEWANYAKVSIAKLRDGEPGYLDLMYFGTQTRFADWPAHEPVPTSQVRVQRAAKEL